jgi:predicted metalloprotease
MRSLRIGLAVAVVAAVVAACGSTAPQVVATRSQTNAGGVSGTTSGTDTTAPTDSTPTTDGTTPDTAPPTTDPTATTDGTPQTTGPIPPPADGGIISFGKGHVAKAYDNFLNAAFEDITAFWAENFPAAYGGTFKPVKGIFSLFPQRTDLPQSCRGKIKYDDVQGNAFYTSCGDIIVYDDDQLIPDLVKQLGQAAVGVVAAHEFGHAIQQRAGVFDIPGIKTIDTEQQADCFAGAWSAHLARGEGKVLRFTDADVRAGLIAMIEVRDPPGVDSENDQSGHGSGFDRVGAFEEGFLKGVSRCKEFPDKPNPRIDLQFLNGTDEANNGNLPFDQLLTGDTDMLKSLTTLWKPTLDAAKVTFTPPTVVAIPSGSTPPACGTVPAAQLLKASTFCPDSNEIVYDEAFLKKLYDRLGDLSFGYEIASAYSDAVQTALQSPLTGKKRVLLNDCLVGAWLLDVLPSGKTDAQGNALATNPNQTILLSAGDLDEVVSTAIVQGDSSESTNKLGTAFEKIDAFRAGVTGGLSACQARLSG